MSLELLQQRIRRCKTPLALGLSPDSLPEQLLRRFEQLYGPGPMAQAEALRYQGTRLLEAAEGLPAVFLRLESYLPYGPAGLEVLANLEGLRELGCPVLLGASRKSVIGLTLDVPVTERLEGTLVTTVFAVLSGCSHVRVHDVKENVRAARMAEAIAEYGAGK